MSAPTLAWSRVTRAVVVTAALMVVVAGLRAAASIITPFLLAAFIAAVSLPLLEWIRDRGARTGLAILAVVLINAGVLTFFGWIAVESIIELRTQLPAYIERAQALEQAARDRLLVLGLEVGPDYYATFVQPERLFDVATAAARNVTSVLSVGLLILLYLVFMLAESVALPSRWRTVFGAQSQSLLGAARALKQVQRYLALKTLISLTTGALIGTGAWLLDVDFALLWGFLAFALNYIPSIGSIIAAVPAVLVALLQFGPGSALALTGVYLVVNLTIGNVADPILVGRQLRLSPIIVIMSLVFWGWTLGIAGMFLAVPLTIALRIVMQGSSSLGRYALLMGPLPAPGEAVSGNWGVVAGSGEAPRVVPLREVGD